MIRINEHFQKLKAAYLFSEIGSRVAAFREANPQRPIINLGIGDVTEPLPEACRDAMHKAVDELGQRETFRGYGPEQGYDFLREAIAKHDYQDRGVNISADEIFVSDGSKCDAGNIQEIFADDICVAVPDPVYPVYVDTNVMAGRTGREQDGRYENLVYLESRPENNYTPEIPSEPVDLIYLCFPNNPTGTTATGDQLRNWVNYALEHKALIIFDAAYAAYIRDDSLPQSIFEIEGARQVAVELRSFSKNAGFTGTRCAFTVVPKELIAVDAQGTKQSIHTFWSRRQTTKFNGVAYPVQRAAEAVYTPEGRQQVKVLTDFYLENARLIRQAMIDLGYSCAGGDNSPYVWIHTGSDSWESFDLLLEEAGVVCVPGSGFGRCGEGHIRLSGFNSRQNVIKALEQITSALNK